VSRLSLNRLTGGLALGAAGHDAEATGRAAAVPVTPPSRADTLRGRLAWEGPPAMKHSEREHLKENELAKALAAANQAMGQHRTQYLAIGGAIVAVLIAVVGYVTWSRNADNQVSALLADAMVVYEAPVQAPIPPADAGSTATATQAPGSYPTERAKLEAALPKFLAAADASPNSGPGRLARFNAASILVTLGRYDEARSHYDQLASGDDLVAKGAALGRAQAQIRAGQFDPAIEQLKTLSTQSDGTMPADGILMELAKAYRASGKVDDARRTLTEIVEKHAESPYAAEARAELDKLKGAPLGS
jgi:tetratricopeptide (TPR) repeat protein